MYSTGQTFERDGERRTVRYVGVARIGVPAILQDIVGWADDQGRLWNCKRAAFDEWVSGAVEIEL